MLYTGRELWYSIDKRNVGLEGGGKELAKKYCESCDGTGINKYTMGSEACWRCDGSGIDSEYMDEIICPYCAETLSADDLYQSTTIDCDACGKEIELEVDYSVSYTTRKREEINGKILL
jgi:RecJ-like exonuclease